jgi:hypothetical protein
MYTRQHWQPKQRYYCQNDARTDRRYPHHNLPVLQEYVAVKSESQEEKERTTAGAVMIFSVCRKQEQNCEASSDVQKNKQRKHPKVLSF